MPRREKRCRCKKCVLKLEVTNSLGELIPGPQGPIGPPGRVIAETPRSLKVQLMGTEIVPVINQGFLWEAEVLPPPGFPVPGTFTFYRATVLDQEGFSVAEMFNSNGGINHTQVDEIHTSTLAHYRNGVLQDLHSVSSQVPGAQNFLLAQTLHDVVIGDQLYFAISPNVSSLTSFNYTLGSIKMKPSMKLNPNPVRGRSIISVVIPFSGQSAGQSFCIVITDDDSPNTLSFMFMHGATGGGGAGQESTNDGGGAKIGRGGGGGASSWNNSNARLPSLKKGDIIEVFPGIGGAGGTVADPDGKQGQTSFIKLNGELVDTSAGGGDGFPNPTPGGCPGKGGVNGGDGATGGCTTDALGAPGGGGGAPLTDGVPGTPGPGGVGFPDAQPGGTNPRNGGDGTTIGIIDDTPKGGLGGTSSSNNGSGGGGGGGNMNFGGTPPVSSDGGDGGEPGLPGKPGLPGVNIPPTPDAGPNFFGGGGGGGGSGGLPSSGGDPVPGGDGGKGSDAIICLSWEQ